MWLAIRYCKSPDGIKGHKLNEGDILRLGRIKFRVKRICLNHTQDMDMSQIPAFLFKQGVVESLHQGKEDSLPESSSCRICLFDTNSAENPLISPCKCAGTMKYIHLECLRHWLKNRVSIQETPQSAYYYWKMLDCELCKQVLPSTIRVNEENIDMVNISKPTMPYIVLEDIGMDRSSSKGLHVLSLSNGASITIGRGHESEVRINDISVSRQHATIKFEKGNFYLDDCKSKFGTLVQIKRSIVLESSGNVCVQVNRTLINFIMQQNFSLLSFCFRCKCFGRESVLDSSALTRAEPQNEERDIQPVSAARHLITDDNVYYSQPGEIRSISLISALENASDFNMREEEQQHISENLDSSI